MHKYKIEDLYIGEIIYIYHTELYVGPTASLYDSGTIYRCRKIKKFAIFDRNYWHKHWPDYLHIITNQTLRASIYGEAGEYLVRDESIKRFDRALQWYMVQNKLTKESKLSLNQIKELEKFVNEKLYPNQQQDELFW